MNRGSAVQAPDLNTVQHRRSGVQRVDRVACKLIASAAVMADVVFKAWMAGQRHDVSPTTPPNVKVVRTEQAGPPPSCHHELHKVQAWQASVATASPSHQIRQDAPHQRIHDKWSKNTEGAGAEMNELPRPPRGQP